MTKKSLCLFFRKILGLDTTIYDPVVPYDTDIDNPPAFPPNRICNTFGEISISRRQREEWYNYMNARIEKRDQRIQKMLRERPIADAPNNMKSFRKWQ